MPSTPGAQASITPKSQPKPQKKKPILKIMLQ